MAATGTIQVTYNQNLDQLSVFIYILDATNTPNTALYIGIPANIGEDFSATNVFYYFNDTNLPAKIVVNGYSVQWLNNYSLLLSTLSIFLADSASILSPSFTSVGDIKTNIRQYVETQLPGVAPI